MATPTDDGGKPSAATPRSMGCDSTLDRPTTATSETTSSPDETRASRDDGGSAWPSASRSDSGPTGRKKSRCLTVWVNTNSAYNATEATAAKASCDDENSGPGGDVVKRGSTRVTVARVITVASEDPEPSGLKCANPCRHAATSSESPTTPAVVIITAAKTVSRAKVEVSFPEPE